MKKQIFTLFLLLAATLSSVAQTQFWYHGVHYELTDSYGSSTVYVIEADGDTYSGTITIPESVRTKGTYGSGGGEFEKVFTVVGIGDNAFSGCTGLTEVVLPSTLTYIGYDAFNGCVGLTKINLPLKLTSIGYSAFYGCTGLTELTLPKNLSTIGYAAFKGCTGLTNVTLQRGIKTISSNTFSGCTSLSSVTIPASVNTIYGEAFAGCTSLNNVVIPNSVVSMDWRVFYGCSSLTNVTISENVSKLLGTFANCTALTTVTVPAGVTQIEGAFKGCTNLTSVTLPPCLKSIGTEAFDGCTSLSSIYIPNSVTTIQQRAFANTALRTLELPSTLTDVYYNAFYGCNQLTSVTSRRLSPPVLREPFSNETYSLATLHIPAVSLDGYKSANWWKLFENVEGEEAYNNTYDFVSGGLTYLITGNNTVTVTGAQDFNGTDLTIPSSVVQNGVTYSVTAIASNAFANYNLTSLSLPNSLTTIGERAFYGCSGLTSLTIPVNVTFIGDAAFEGLPYLARLEWNARRCRSTGIPFSQIYDVYLFQDYENSYSSYYESYKTNLVELTIGNEVQVLPYGLAAHSQITSVYIPSSVVEICGYALYDCIHLTSLTIPENVTIIDNTALSFCKGLTSLTWNARNCGDYGGLFYEFHSEMTGYSDDTHEIISDLIEVEIGDQVEVLPDNFVRNTSVSDIVLPESLKRIGNYAFYNCWNLSGHLIIGDQVTEIGTKAFGGCSSVSQLTVGRNVEYIGDYAFGSGVDATYNGYVPPMQVTTLRWNACRCKTSGSLNYYNVTNLYIGGGVEILPDYFAQSARNLTSFGWSSSIKVIGKGAFSSCPFFRELSLPSSVEVIGDEAFKYCSGLTSVTLPETLTTIGPGAFSYCSQLTGLYLPASVVDFGEGAFKVCDALASIVVDSANPVYDSRENCNALFRTADNYILLTCKNTTIPSTLTDIPDYAFFDNSTLTSMDIPSTVRSIGRYAFSQCHNLTSINIPNSVTTIGENAFSRCGSLNSLHMSESLLAIEPYTFAYCYDLKNVEIPASVNSIAKNAFLYCSSLESLSVADGNPTYDSRDNSNCIIETASNELIIGCANTDIPETVTAIGDTAFLSCQNLQSINIPASIERVGSNAFADCYYLKRVNISDVGAWSQINFKNMTSNPLYNAKHLFVDGDEVTGITIPAGITEIKQYAFTNCLNLKNVSIPNSVKSIENSAFNGCTNLSKVTMSNSIDTIGAYAFVSCKGLKNIGLGNSLRYIGEKAFYSCDSLTAVTMPNTVDSIGVNAFGYCKNLVDLRLSTSLETITNDAFRCCSALTSVTIPHSVKTIGYEAFYYCGALNDVTIGQSVNRIDNYAFYSCSALTTVTCLAKTPPTIYWSTFNGNVLTNGVLRVPQGTMAAYKANSYWARFKNIVEIPGAGPGDVNGDGNFSISDVTGLIDLLLNGGELPIYADVDGDGRVTIKDVTDLISMLLSL